MSDDILGDIDAAVEGVREDLCGCGCPRRVTPDSPSPYFAASACQTSWYLQQRAIAEGEPERAEEMRRQRAEDPAERLRRRTMGYGPSDGDRAERERVRIRVVEWLRANNIDPMRVAQGYPIVTTPSMIVVHDYVRDEDGQPRVVDGEVPTVETVYPLLTPWPADLTLDDRRHELDDDAVNDRPEHAVFTTVAGAVGLLSSADRLDATALPSCDPLAYRVRCTGCGKRGTPPHAWVYPTSDGGTRMRWICGCGNPVATTDFTATVERFAQADGLHLRLGRGGDVVHYVLPEHQYSSHVTLDPIWREMERLLATGVRLPWSDPRSDPLRDIRETAERARTASVSVAPVGTPPDAGGWVEIGWTTDDGLRAEELPRSAAARGFHNAGRAVDLTGEVDTAPIQRAILAAQAAMAQFWIPALQMAQAFAALRSRVDNPMLRAIEAKKNQTHGPQRTKRAPRRIDPRRGR